MKFFYILIVMFLFSVEVFISQEHLLITQLNNPSPGYLYFSDPLWGNSNFSLYDNYGIPHIDSSMSSTNKFELPDLGDSAGMDQHDMLILPNNRYLIAMSNSRVIDLSQIIDGGRVDAIVKGCLLLEIDEDGNIYWSWNAFDHIAITEVTNDIDLTQPVIDYTHFNSLALDLDGNLLVSFRHLDQIVKINKNIGNIVWSLGGSASKSNDFHFTNDDQDGFFGFSHQHSIKILANGNLLMFDNGNLKHNPYSRAVEYQLDQTNFVATKVWEYRKDPDVYIQAMGNVQRLSNGNTLINWASQVTEVKPNGIVALETSLYDAFSYRAIKVTNLMDFAYKYISGNGVYQYADLTNYTGIKLDINFVSGVGTTWIEKHNYAPPVATFSIEDFSSILENRWVISSDSVTAMSGKLIISTDVLKGNHDFNKLSILKRNKETTGDFVPLTTSYNAGSKELWANFSGLGEVIVVSNILSTQSLFSPSNTSSGIDIPSRLQWHKLKGAISYRVQISSDINFNDLILNSTISIDTSITYDNLENDKQYYWRVCGINSKDTSDWSNVWNFRTKIPGTNLLSPVNNQFGVKFTDTLRWTHTGSGSKYWLQLSLDSNFVNVLDNQRNLTNNSFVLNLQDYNKKYFWRVLTSKGVDSSNWSKFNCFTTKMTKPLLLIPSNDSLNLPRSLSLYWSTVSGTNNFKVNICSTRDFTTDSVYIYTASTNQLEVSGLQNSRDYYWKVQAVRTTDSSEFSEIFKFSTLLTNPKLLSPAMDSVGLTENILFEWEAQANADYYIIQIASDYGFENLFYEQSISELNKTTVSELPDYTKFYWRVMYADGSKLSEWSEINIFTSGKGPALSIPTLSNPTNNSLNHKINGSFEWVTVENAKYYRIQISEDSEFSQVVLDSSGIRINSYHYKDLEYTQKYYWRVKAYREYDSSLWSPSWNMTTMHKLSLSSVSLVEPEYDALQVSVDDTLEWEKVVKAEKYQVQLSLDSLFSILLINSENLVTSYYHYTTLEKNRTYYWRVRYITSIDTSDWSSIWEFSTLTEEKLMEPKLLGPDNNIYGMPVTGRLEWESVSGATTYKVRLSKSLAFYPRVLSVSWHKDLELHYSGLEYNTQYYWRVAGQNDESTSNWSDARSFYTELSQPILLYPADNADKQLTKGELKWEKTDGASYYILQITTDNTFDLIDLENNTGNDNHFDYTLENDKKYFWRVKAFNSLNSSKWTESRSFYIYEGTDVKDFEDSDYFRAYPCPANEIIYIEVEKSPIELDISLINSFGEKVLGNESLNLDKENNYNFSIQNLESGLYYIVIKQGLTYYVKKIVVVK